MKQAESYLPEVTLNFFRSQMYASRCKRAHSMRWSDNDKLLALSIYYHGPKAYRFLSKIFRLPSIQSLRRWIRNLNMKPGFSTEISQILSKKFSRMTQMGKYCVLTFDEMSIKTALRYDSASDCFIGTEDYGSVGGRGKGLASQALVVMVHGLTNKWKQVLGYFLASGGTKAAMLKNIVCSAIDMISDIGGNVVAITCDQGANNRALFSNLGVTVESPFFVHSSAKIFCFFDPPHLFKSVRNNLMKHDIQIRNKVVKWQHICDFFDIDSKQPIRLCPKLTNKHFNLTNFTKMKVSYACQVMSKSVAAAIMTHVSFKSLPPEAADTASFLERMDNLIDCFNSRTLLSKLKPHKAALSSKSVHNQFLKDSLQWIQKWNVIGARSQLPCVYGLQVTISALLQLWDCLRTECSFQFLLTSRLNQDCLENLFSIVRQAGGCRDSPNAEQFGQSLRQCAIKSLLLAPKSANCVLDSDVILASLSDFASRHVRETEDVPVATNMPQSDSVVSSEHSLCIVSQQLDMSDFVCKLTAENILFYISGYIMKKIGNIHHCSDQNCSIANLESDCGMFVSDSQTFTYHKAQLTEKGDFGGLKCPSDQFVHFVTEMETVFCTEINKLSHLQKITPRLLSRMPENVNDQLPVCDLAVSQIKRLFLVTRLHAAAKFFSRTISGQSVKGDRKNRKAAKVMHL